MNKKHLFYVQRTEITSFFVTKRIFNKYNKKNEHFTKYKYFT